MRRIIQLFLCANIGLLFCKRYEAFWTKTYGGVNNDYGSAVEETLDKGYIIAGRTESFGAGKADVYVIKTDSKGDTLWTRTYGGPADDGALSVKQTRDEGYIIAGITASFNRENDVYLIKIDKNGNTLWIKTYGGAKDDRAYSVLQTEDGGYIIAGITKSFGSGNGDVYVIKTNDKGDTLWTKTYGGVKEDGAFFIQHTRDGGYIIAGWTRSFGAGHDDVYLLKIDRNGDTMWTKTYGGVNDDGATCVQQTKDGGYIITGITGSFGTGGDVYLIKTDKNGDLLWSKNYGGKDTDYGASVLQTSDRGYIITGWTRSFGAGGFDVYIIKIDAQGNLSWAETYGGKGWDWGQCIIQTSDKGYVIAGTTNSFGSGNYDVYLVKLPSIPKRKERK